tara:strand:- start:607 stop:1020 length:414 start_codon:yes stop_codon:yes gene_type:complete
MIEDFKNIKTDKKLIRDFAILIGSILIVLFGYLILKGKDPNVLIVFLGIFFICSGFIFPTILKPIYLVWMYFATILGWIMTRLILALVFYLIVSPIGVFGRIFGKEFLALKKNKMNKSYWNYIVKNKNNQSEFDRQF